MFSIQNAQEVTEKLNSLLASSSNKVPKYEKFNVQFLGNDVDFGIDTDDETVSDFVNPCAMFKLSINCRRVLNYIHYHSKENGKFRKVTDEEISAALGLSIKTVCQARKKLVSYGLIERVRQSVYKLTFEVLENKNYFYINTLWFTEAWNFDIEVDGVVYRINRRLTPQAVFTLYAIVRHYTYQNKYFCSSQRRLAKFLNCAASTIGNTFRLLENGGFMRRLFVKDGNTYDSLGVNGSWLTNFIINENIVRVAKNTQDDAADKKARYNEYSQPRGDKSAEQRVAAFMLSITPVPDSKVMDIATVYLNRVIDKCKDDAKYQQLTEEKMAVVAQYERKELTEREAGAVLTDVLRRQRAYLKSKGLPPQALEINYQKRRAKRYLTSDNISPHKPRKTAKSA